MPQDAGGRVERNQTRHVAGCALLNFTRLVEGYWIRLLFALRPGGAPARSVSFSAKAKSTFASLGWELSQVPALMLREWQLWTVLACAAGGMLVMQVHDPPWYFGGEYRR